MKEKGTLQRLYLLLFIFFLLLGAAVSVDWLIQGGKTQGKETYPDAVELGEDGRLPEPFPHTDRRMFILIIDCLSYDSATDPDLMPSLDRIRDNSTYGYMRNSMDAITVPSIKAAFTGKDHFSLFSVVSDFRSGYAVSSVFSQLSEENVTISVYTDISFKQFGDDITTYEEVDRVRWDWEENAQREKELAKEAIDDYQDGKHDIVILHLLEVHDVVHKLGPGSQSFPKSLKDADEIVRKAAAAVPDDEYLLIMGDHGHDERGRHSYGLDVPTYFNIRGPGFKEDLEQRIAITDIRFFVSWAMGLPLPDNYDAGIYPQALVSRGPLPDDYSQEYLTLEEDRDQMTSIKSSFLPYFGATLVNLGLLASCWLVMVFGYRSIPAIPLWKRILAFISIIPLLLPSVEPALTFLGAIISAMCLVVLIDWRKANAKKAKKRVKIAAITLAGCMFVTFWGYLLYFYRFNFYFKSFVPFIYWFLMAIIGLFITRRKGPVFASWMAFLIPFFVFYPTIYSYGWLACMGPSLICFSLFHLWDHYTRSKKNGSNQASAKFGTGKGLAVILQGMEENIFKPTTMRKIVISVLPIALVGILFFGQRGMNFQFRHWYVIRQIPLLVVSGIALAAKFFLFLRSKKNIFGHIFAASALLLVFSVEIQFIQLSKVFYLSLTAAFVAISILFHFHKRWDSGIKRLLSGNDMIYIRNTAVLSFMMLLTYYTIRINYEFHLLADILLAGIYFTAVFLKKRIKSPYRYSGQCFILAISVLMGGWVTLAWTVHNLEWFFLYDWFPEAILESRIAFFLPLITFRFILPLLMAVFIVKQTITMNDPEGGDEEGTESGRGRSGSYGLLDHQKQLVFSLMALKLFSLIFIFYGMGYNASSNIFFEVVQQSVILVLLLFALL